MATIDHAIPVGNPTPDDVQVDIRINEEKLSLLGWRLFSPISEIQVTSDPLNPSAPKSAFNESHPLAKLSVTIPPVAKLEIYISIIEDYEWMDEEEHESQILTIKNDNMNAITIFQFVTEVSKWAVEKQLKDELEWTTSFWKEWYVRRLEGPHGPEDMPGAKTKRCWGIMLHGEQWLPEGGWWQYLSDPLRYRPRELAVNLQSTKT